MAAMDIFVFPSIFEGFGLVLVEAQASGLCCFASDIVPNETKLSENITYLPLDAGVERWADAITQSYEKKAGRNVDHDRFIPYDIGQSKNILMNAYLKMNNSCGG